MKSRWQAVLSFSCIWLLCATFGVTAAAAQTLTGTVTNRTVGKPATGDEVILITLASGMEESGHTKTDAKGNFTLKMDGGSSPHLVRVVHQGVTYHRMAPPGTTSVEVEVFDVAKKVEGISVTADVMRFQAQNNELQGVRIFAVNNASEPPRTQMNEQNFEFYLPEGAIVDTGMSKTANGQPLTNPPAAMKEKGRFAFNFPLRPGETQFQVVYHLPYKGEASIDPKQVYGAQHFVVMLPKSMQFAAGAGATFQSMQDPRKSDSIVQVASNTQPGNPLSFKLSGTGILPEETEGGGAQQPAAGGGGMGGGESAANGRDTRPGGGLGPPIDAPDPLEKYRWYILGAFALALAAGGVYIARRAKTTPSPDFASDMELNEAPAAVPTRRVVAPAVAAAAAPVMAQSMAHANGGRSSSLLDVLKDEMFQLEMEHKQGEISQAEYEKAKAGLDSTLERALKRKTVSSS